jgi:DNA-binding transcriptional MerR regulator
MLAIGDFSRITHLSIRTLRHYHEVGLLEPAEVDSSSGYRHYTLDQVPIAQVIRRFRDLDMPVERVREVLLAPDLATRNKLIAEHLSSLESKLAQTQAAVATLRGLLGAEPATIAVELRSVPPIRTLAIRAVVARGDLIAWWRGALGELEATCDAQQLVRTGAPGGTFAMEIFELERGDATVFVPIAGDARRSAAPRRRRSLPRSSRSRNTTARTTISTSPMARSARTSHRTRSGSKVPCASPTSSIRARHPPAGIRRSAGPCSACVRDASHPSST